MKPENENNVESRKRMPACASCEKELFKRICMTEKGLGSTGCPTLTRKDVLHEANREYDKQPMGEFARQASIQEAECYANRHGKPYIMQPQKTRIVEICEFSQRMGYTRLGLAFCGGLVHEATLVESIFREWGFEVVSVICKAGRTPKSVLGLEDKDTIFLDRNEAMCNPIYQARLLNHEHTEFNVLLGLCVGHDSLFFQYAEAPTTVLAAKDRVTGHNPLAAVYLSSSYYAKIKHKEM